MGHDVICSINQKSSAMLAGIINFDPMWHNRMLSDAKTLLLYYINSNALHFCPVMHGYKSGFHLGISPWGGSSLGHGEGATARGAGEGAGGGCAPSRAERKRKFYLFLEDSLLANSFREGITFLSISIAYEHKKNLGGKLPPPPQ